MKETKQMTPNAPIININGTSKEVLIESVTDAINALFDASTALAKTGQYIRDYPNVTGKFVQAQKEHSDRMARIASVMNELQELGLAISLQA
jgi:hypothetical protein